MRRSLVDERHSLERVRRETRVLPGRELALVRIRVRAASEPVPNAIGSEEPAYRDVAQRVTRGRIVVPRFAAVRLDEIMNRLGRALDEFLHRFAGRVEELI